MNKLTDPNPYSILGLDQNADKAAIKRALAERNRSAKNQRDRQQALEARKALTSIERRLLIDAMLPDFPSVSNDELGQLPFPQKEDNWSDLINNKTLLLEVSEALIDATVDYVSPPMPCPSDPELDTQFDNLDGFIRQWLH